MWLINICEFVLILFLVQEVQAEGKYAIDSPGCATVLNLPPEDYNLGEFNLNINI